MLDKIFNFIMICKENDRILKKDLNIKSSDTVKSKNGKGKQKSKNTKIPKSDIGKYYSEFLVTSDEEQTDEQVDGDVATKDTAKKPKKKKNSDSESSEEESSEDLECVKYDKEKKKKIFPIKPKGRRKGIEYEIDKKRIGLVPSSLCSICGKKYNNPVYLERHLKTHRAEYIYPCSVCGKKFTNNQYLKQHELRHTRTKGFPCTECGKKFYTLYYARLHMKNVHLKQTRTNCQICDKDFSTCYIKAHMMTHTGERKYECHICKKQCVQRSSMLSHMRVHTGERPYECRYCPSKFSILRSRNEHERLHTGETPYKCSVCGKGFAQRANMKSHFKYNHKIDYD